MSQHGIWSRRVACLAAVVVGCLLPSFLPAAETTPLKVAVFVDKGARGEGCYRWIELVSRMKSAEMLPVDGDGIRKGALDAADVLVVPGGRSVQEARSLGPEGRECVRAFVKRGGGYVGTCAGCCLLMEPAPSHHPDMIHMIPYRFGPCGGETDISIAFNHRAEALAGIKKGRILLRYADGPVPQPSLPVADAQIEVVARYNGDVNAEGAGPRLSMAGQAAALAGTYGKGRIFVLSVHPEVDPSDHDILKGAFRYVSGREVTWDWQQRRRGQLAVGLLADDSPGIETARLIQKLVTGGEFDVSPVTRKTISEGALRHLDAVLAPNGMSSVSPRKGLYGSNLARTKEFLSRGGRIYAWGSAAQGATNETRVTVVAGPVEAVAALRAFAAQPVPPAAALPPKVARPLNVAVYKDKGGGDLTISTMLALSPEYRVRVLSAADYAKGGLNGMDLVIQPGGSARAQYNRLGAGGVEALTRFVRDGGKYYGVCAGAFLAAQVSRPDYPRLGLVPFKGDDPAHYRGSSPILIKLTPEGLRDAFTGSASSRTVLYYGGPAFIPGDPIADTDVKVFGHYLGRLINTRHPQPVEEMRGKGAFVGGRVGKGKVFLSCPHPEDAECNMDLVRGGLTFLTGVKPSVVNRDRVRGAVAVRYCTSDIQSVQFYLDTLLRDRRLDLHGPSEIGDLSHIDVIVITGERSRLSAKYSTFLARGGKIVLLADTEAKRAAAAKITGVSVVTSYDKLIDEILRK